MQLRQANSMLVDVDGHSIEVRRTQHGINAELIESGVLTSIQLRKHRSANEYALFIDDDTGETAHELASFTRCSDGDGMFLKHLDVPAPIRGNGIGSVALAVFYAVCRIKGCSEFAVKFGRAHTGSLAFLEAVGFEEEDIGTVQDSDYGWASAVVGEIGSRKVGEEYSMWTLDSIPLTRFPTGVVQVL